MPVQKAAFGGHSYSYSYLTDPVAHYRIVMCIQLDSHRGIFCRAVLQVAAVEDRPGVMLIKGLLLREAVSTGPLLLDDAKLAGAVGNKPLTIDLRKHSVLVESGSPTRMSTSINSLGACHNRSSIVPAALQLELHDRQANPVSHDWTWLLVLLRHATSLLLI